jgi:hypothetical protein
VFQFLSVFFPKVLLPIFLSLYAFLHYYSACASAFGYFFFQFSLFTLPYLICVKLCEITLGLGAGAERAGEIPHPPAVRESGGDGGQVQHRQPTGPQASQRRFEGSSSRHEQHSRQEEDTLAVYLYLLPIIKINFYLVENLDGKAKKLMFSENVMTI